MIPCPRCGHLNEETARNCVNSGINIEGLLLILKN